MSVGTYTRYYTGKWKPIILWVLGKEPLSLSQLEHNIKKITQKMLLEQLKELISFAIISKQTFDGYPLKVEYSLTDGDVNCCRQSQLCKK